LRGARSHRIVRVMADVIDIHGGRDPRELPLYSVAEAAGYLSIPASTLRSWVKGQHYTEHGQEPRVRRCALGPARPWPRRCMDIGPGSASTPGCGSRPGGCEPHAQLRDERPRRRRYARCNASGGPSQRPKEVYVDHEAEDGRALAHGALAGRRRRGGSGELSRTGHHRDVDRRRSDLGGHRRTGSTRGASSVSSAQ
jgi:hypothetical protein